MGAIRLKTEDLDHRRSAIRRMLKPLRAYQPVACGLTHDKAGNGMVLGAHDGHVRDKDYREWYFRSSAKNVWCQYFEVWNDTEPQNRLSLVRAYFTVFIADRATGQFEELLCIHCDPNDESDMKRGPHLHVTKAIDPLPKCHFPLNYSHLDHVLTSIQTLHDAMYKAIVIVAKEVIPRFPTNI